MKKRTLSIILTLTIFMSAFSCLSQASLFRVNATALNPIPDDIKPLVFDASFYADSHQDLKNAFGYDEAMLYNHFINNGIREGRCASPYFDIKWYMTQNDQVLIDACNGDTVFAMNHFLSFVKDKTEMSNTPKKMSQIFDTSFYADKYSELNTIFTTEYDYMNHFVTYGANEMRTGSAEFDIVSYAIYNDDLFAFFNNNPSDYYRHFMMNVRYETDNQQRQMYAVKCDTGDDFYATITSKNSNNALELTYHNESSPYPDKNAVIAKEANSTDSQLWHFTRQADNTYKIENVAFGKILDVAHFSHVDATVGAYNDNNNTADASTYSQRSKIDNRLHAAPLWDYDMAYGQYETPRMIAPNVYGESAKTSDWHSKIKGIFGNEGVLNSQATVINNKEVWHRVKQLWNGSNGFYETAYELLNGTGEGTIPYYIERLRGTAKMNESRWGFIGQDLIKAGGLNNTGSNYQETTDFFISWTTERLNWMHNGLSNTTPLLLGDINNDSITNITDATELQKVLALLAEYSKDDFATICDVNADGNVDIKDVTYIQFWCAGINL